jgi:biopolymer transport protein TolR
MAFSAGSSSLPSSEINVTPLIDVLLVLLIIFMVIVPVTPRGLTSQIPKPSRNDSPLQAPVSVRILADSSGRPVRHESRGGCSRKRWSRPR